MDEDRSWRKWIGFVRDAMACMIIESEKISVIWSHLPGAGGYYDQDEWIMTVWESVRRSVINAFCDKNFMESLRGKHG